MSRPRFRAFRVRAGRVILDRKTGAWYLIAAGRIIDYGTVRRLPGFTVYLPGRAVS